MFVFLFLVGLFVLLWLAGHYGITLYPFPCGFKQRYELPCPTCGMSTAVMAFAQGKIAESFYTQPAAAFLCCVLVGIALVAFFTAVSGLYFRHVERFLAEVRVVDVIIALVIIIAAGWAVTLARALATKPVS